MTISLPDEITEDEKLARVICASSKPKRYKRTAFYYDESEKRYVVLVGQFISHNNPIELSVNRISTISLELAHQLGLNHRNDYQPQSTYHGFAELRAALCFENGCKVEKDDLGGTKPYHANIIYPYAQGEKENDQEMAAQLAYHAEFKKYN